MVLPVALTVAFQTPPAYVRRLDRVLGDASVRDIHLLHHPGGTPGTPGPPGPVGGQEPADVHHVIADVVDGVEQDGFRLRRPRDISPGGELVGELPLFVEVGHDLGGVQV